MNRTLGIITFLASLGVATVLHVAKAASTVVIPEGTTITVSMIDSIDSTKIGPGARFRASIDDPIVVANRVIIPRGADCKVQVVQVEENKQLALKLYDVTVGEKTYDVAASYAQLE